jgi:hypothetical protein
MSEHATDSTSNGDGDGEGLADPGRDPKGIGGPPRNPMGAGPDQDSGRGRPEAQPGIEGQSMMPESPDGDDDRV